MSRRLCTAPCHHGPRWCRAVDFNVKQWDGPRRVRPKRLQAWCKACQRMVTRVRLGLRRRGVPYEARRARTAQELRHRRRVKRECDRLYATMKRREAGVRAYPPRQPLVQQRMPVDPAPFMEWFAEHCALVGMDVGTALERCGVDRAVWRRWRQPDRSADYSTLVTIATKLNMPHIPVILYDDA